MTDTQREEEDWVQLAMGDACLVANLLLRLVGHPPPSSKRSRTWLNWAIRGPRSRGPPPRGSPSTPLSWTTEEEEEEEEESHPLPLEEDGRAARSKGTLASGPPSAGKRPRQKKKSLFELKEEESLLLKERQSLKQELASLKLRVEEERAANESLKRLRVDSVPVDNQERLVSQSACHQRDAVKRPCGPPMVKMCKNAALLPDLNLPLEEQ
ncbi:hypothetical protein MLD38_029395 [Melastoma candidum]|uniref:Uncharacterized protein n=1 Tax=Melastoma candidum TaxID=119954 RepID=A0ACB9N4R4_9MYRT|nr:hypothetical protein MLD38_029395 [Melastoma candidum]